MRGSLGHLRSDDSRKEKDCALLGAVTLQGSGRSSSFKCTAVLFVINQQQRAKQNIRRHTHLARETERGEQEAVFSERFLFWQGVDRGNNRERGDVGSSIFL
jgi:hypothetical protein